MRRVTSGYSFLVGRRCRAMDASGSRPRPRTPLAEATPHDQNRGLTLPTAGFARRKPTVFAAPSHITARPPRRPRDGMSVESRQARRRRSSCRKWTLRSPTAWRMSSSSGMVSFELDLFLPFPFVQQTRRMSPTLSICRTLFCRVSMV